MHLKVSPEALASASHGRADKKHRDLAIVALLARGVPPEAIVTLRWSAFEQQATGHFLVRFRHNGSSETVTWLDSPATQALLDHAEVAGRRTPEELAFPASLYSSRPLKASSIYSLLARLRRRLRSKGVAAS